MKLYLDEGWLNVEDILNNKKIWLFVLLGARRVGKTYGVLKYMLDHDKRFVFLRRTTSELESMSSTPMLSPFYDIDENIVLDKNDKYTYKIHKADDDHILSIGAALGTFAKIRGFSGSAFEYLVYDEFIPEKHVHRIKNEGDAFLNLYTTINSNRELQGKQPLKAVLMANTNMLNHDILDKLNLIDIIERMKKKGQEYYINEKTGVFVLNSEKSPIASARAETALYQQIDKDSEFARMSLGNDFAYDDMSNIKPQNFRHYTPLVKCTKNGKVKFVIGENSDGDYYVYNMKLDTPDTVELNETGTLYFRTAYRYLVFEYVCDHVHFQTFGMKNEFLKAFDMI